MVAKSYKKYVLWANLDLLMLKYDFIKYDKYTFEKYDVFENTSTFL